MASDSIHAELIAVLSAVTDGGPRVMTIAVGASLPSGPLESTHRSLQHGLRAWVADQTGQAPGFLEQLYTFADRDRNDVGGRTISISYLGLMREHAAAKLERASWRGWYDYFPWEDHRGGVPVVLEGIGRELDRWSGDCSPSTSTDRKRRVAMAFGFGNNPWNEDLVLQRYELLHEAGLVAEARDHAATPFGRAMAGDHRRILATAIARLRAKIKYRPVVFELMPDQFTLLQLQRTVEALAGLMLYKPNFRRLIEQHELVEETGESQNETGGRPAKLFRFRRSVVEEREFAGSKLPLSRV
jgi:hypothetical protein